MSMRRKVLAIAGSVALATGCGGNEEDRYSLVPVSGAVTLDGKPLEGVVISFVPDPGNKPKTDGGDVTGSGGSFEAKYRNRAGLAPGKYKVVVAQPESGPGGGAKGKALPEEIAKSSYMAGLASKPSAVAGKAVAGKGAAGKGETEAEWVYGDAKKSPLSQEVSARGDSGLKFALKSSASK